LDMSRQALVGLLKIGKKSSDQFFVTWHVVSLSMQWWQQAEIIRGNIVRLFKVEQNENMFGRNELD